MYKGLAVEYFTVILNFVEFSLWSCTGKSIRFQGKPDLEKPYAHLALEVQQEPNSLEIITEIDPVDLADLFGNVGGFWGEPGMFWEATIHGGMRSPR